jgi:acetyltransferase-like isoleucine patch superfamily enzyme
VTIGISGKGDFKGRFGQPVGDPDTKTVIGDGVWIGSNAVVVGDVVIGDGAKIGAGATVAKNVPDNATVVCRSEILTKN